MKQYEFEAINRTRGNVERIRATAANADIARAQIVLAYGTQFDVLDLYRDINPPHHILGEIDCSDFPLSDLPWLMSEAAAIEGAAQ